MNQQVTPDQAVELALKHHRAGKLQDAEGLYRQVLAADPNHPAATRMLGILASQCGNHGDSVALLGRALQLQPHDAAVALDLAIAYRSAGKLQEADQTYRFAISLSPSSAAPPAAYGQFLMQVGRVDDATTVFRQATELDPSVGNFNQLGIVLAARERFEDAAESFNRCLAIDPTFATAYNNLGTALVHQRKLAEAEVMFRNAIAVDANYVQALDNLGGVLARQNRHADAIPVLESAIAVNPAAAQPHESLAAVLLATGDWARGFTEREAWVNRVNASVPPSISGKPRWDGGELNGRAILLHAADGPGDAILFARYIPLVARRGGRITLLCPKPLTELLARLPGVQRVIGPTDPLPAFDVQCSVASLPHHFSAPPGPIPSAKAAYLSAPPEHVEKWKAILADTPGKRVGVGWGANPRDPVRSPNAIPPSALAPLARIGGVAFYRLPLGYAVESMDTPAGVNVIDHVDKLADPADVAGLVKNLDLIITPDAPIAHLAGALGRPTAVMLPHAADWRWMISRNDSPWYGSARLYRQATPGDWSNVVERVTRSLEVWAKK